MCHQHVAVKHERPADRWARGLTHPGMLPTHIIRITRLPLLSYLSVICLSSLFFVCCLWQVRVPRSIDDTAVLLLDGALPVGTSNCERGSQ